MASTLPTPAYDLDLSPNIVNPRLSALGGDPDSFPTSAPWLDLLHAKGHMSRVSHGWLRDFLSAKLAEGSAPKELGCWCALMLFSGNAHASRAFSILSTIAPEACSILFDESATAYFSNFAIIFQEASREWTAPQDLSVRGWSKAYSDREIQDLTRETYAKIADSCARIAAIGLPQAFAALAAEIEPSPIALPGGAFVERESGLTLRNMVPRAITFISIAGLLRDGLRSSWISQRREEIAATAGLHCGPKTFRRVLALLSDDSKNALLISGRAIAMILRSAAISDSKSLSSQQERFGKAGDGARHKGLDLINFFCHWGIPNTGGPAPFFEGLFNGPIDASFAARLDALVSLCGKPSKPLTVLGLALAAHAQGRDLGAGQACKQAIWGAHIDAASPSAKPGHKSINGQTYGDNHLALCASFPDEACAKESLSLASAWQVAEIEHRVMSAHIPAFAVNPGIAGESLADDSPLFDEAPLEKKRSRLRL